VHGDYISYDANAEYAEVIGGTKTENGVTSNGRVKAIIQPKNKQSQPKTSSQAESLNPTSAAPTVTKTLRFSNKLGSTANPETPASE
jgi:lipopolysaccharide export system protein LptA